MNKNTDINTVTPRIQRDRCCCKTMIYIYDINTYIYASKTIMSWYIDKNEVKNLSDEVKFE